MTVNAIYEEIVERRLAQASEPSVVQFRLKSRKTATGNVWTKHPTKVGRAHKWVLLPCIPLRSSSDLPARVSDAPSDAAASASAQDQDAGLWWEQVKGELGF